MEKKIESGVRMETGMRMEKGNEEERVRKERKEKEEEETTGVGARAAVVASKVGRARLIDRDRQLLMVLAEGRLLSSRQLSYLFFHGRSGSAARMRLGALEDAGLIERTSSRKLEGAPEICWSLSGAGRRAVEGWWGTDVDEPGDVQAEYLEHHVFFSEVFVRLLGGGLEARLQRIDTKAGRLQRQKQLGQLYARSEHRSWRWVASGATLQLPWREFTGGEAKDRLIRPDALLEFGSRRLRVFIEGETGSQPIQSRNKSRHGATTAKLDRYLAYVTGLADAAARVTWYQQRFPDGFAPELVLLLPAGQRLKNVEAAIQAWKAQKPLAAKLVITALSVDGVLEKYGPLAGVAQTSRASPLAPAGPGPGELVVAREFFESVRADLKRRQALVAQAQQQSPERKVSMPAIPARYEEMKALVARWAGGTQ